MLNTVLVVLIGLALGALVNWLANWLPQYRMNPASDSSSTSEETPEDSESASEEPTRANQQPVFRYVMVELVLAAVAVLLLSLQGLGLLFAIYLAYISLFVLIAVIDFEHRLVLNVVMIPAFGFAIVETLFTEPHSPSLVDQALRAFAGYGMAQVIVIAIFLGAGAYLSVVNASRSDPVRVIPFGAGDVTLATFCGFVVGFPDVVPMLVYMILIGGAIAVLFILYRLVILRNFRAHLVMPYGPAIVIAAAMMLIDWPPLPGLF
ncbi:MAG: prepilin peptidase [Chloroflexi bacterium]|nr:prepilin peptidase [Chloroflexota bacterium]